MKKVCFLSDFLFHDPNNRATYHNWFYNLCTPIFKSIGIEDHCEFLYIKNKNGEKFNREVFFKISDVKGFQNSYYLYDMNEIKKQSWDYFFDFINKDCLIFGFELGEDLRKKLDDHNITFINFWIHSFKLFNDITFMASTNSKRIFNVLKKYQIPASEFNFFGNFWKTYIIENNIKNDKSIENNSVLFIGQMPQDKSVQKGSDFLTILDFKKEVENEAIGFSKIYYQEHPAFHACKDHRIITAINDYINSTPYIEKLPSHIKTYGLLSSDKIVKVLALSSSVVYEASFFGKQTKYLYKPLFDIDSDFGLNTFISINNKLWSEKFWAEVFNLDKANIFKASKKYNESSYLEYHKDYVRDIKKIYFGYSFLDREFFSKNCCSTLNTKFSLLEKEFAEIKKSTVQAKQNTSDKDCPVASHERVESVKTFPAPDVMTPTLSTVSTPRTQTSNLDKFQANFMAMFIPSKKGRHELRERLLNKKSSHISNENVFFNRSNFDMKTKKFVVSNINYRPGINSIGFFHENIGLSHAARYFTRTLVASQTPFCTKHFDLKKEEKVNYEFDPYMINNPIYNTNVFNFNSNYCIEYYKKHREDFSNRYNIMYPYWEYDKYPLDFLQSCNFIDEIWCPSNFILEVLSKYHNKPCVKVPLAINFNENIPSYYNRKFFNIPEDKFVFMFTFDAGSELNGRKNPFDVINAFNNAFSEKDNVCLVIKIAARREFLKNPKYIESRKRLESQIMDKNVILLENTIDDEQMKALIRACDVYVSLHKCEGLGLGMMEAMKLGKPVIATNYSGNTEFMKSWNSCLVDFKLCESSLPGYQWATPDIEHASYFMKKLYCNNEYYKKIAIEAKAYMEAYHSDRAVSEIIQLRLRLLGLL